MLVRESFALKRQFTVAQEYDVVGMIVRVDLMNGGNHHRLIIGEGGTTYHSGWDTNTERSVTGKAFGTSIKVDSDFPDNVVVFGMASVF
jgi:hypothetical protein